MPSHVSRRQFMRYGSALTVLTISGGIWTCSNSTEPEDDLPEPTTLTVRSSDSNGHNHSIVFQRSLFESPPENDRTFTSGGSHTHTITLSSQEMTSIGNGGTVTKVSSTSGGHSHSFTIRL